MLGENRRCLENKYKLLGRDFPVDETRRCSSDEIYDYGVLNPQVIPIFSVAFEHLPDLGAAVDFILQANYLP